MSTTKAHGPYSEVEITARQGDPVLAKCAIPFHIISQKQIRPKNCPLSLQTKRDENGQDESHLNFTGEALQELGPLSKEQEADLKTKAYLQITGTSNLDIAKFIISNTTVPLAQDKFDDKLNIVLQGFYEMNPSDAIEGMLCSQILALYSQGMANLTKANNASSPERAESYMRCSIKLLRLQQETIEKLEKYRRKGQQSVHVEHVHVHPGSQAIVGTVNAGGRGNT